MNTVTFGRLPLPWYNDAVPRRTLICGNQIKHLNTMSWNVSRVVMLVAGRSSENEPLYCKFRLPAKGDVQHVEGVELLLTKTLHDRFMLLKQLLLIGKYSLYVFFHFSRLLSITHFIISCWLTVNALGWYDDQQQQQPDSCHDDLCAVDTLVNTVQNLLMHIRINVKKNCKFKT